VYSGGIPAPWSKAVEVSVNVMDEELRCERRHASLVSILPLPVRLR
jgi:hypothetical protein